MVRPISAKLLKQVILSSTEKQAIAKAKFTEAHLFAQSIINDPISKAAYTKRPMAIVLHILKQCLGF